MVNYNKTLLVPWTRIIQTRTWFGAFFANFVAWSKYFVHVLFDRLFFLIETLILPIKAVKVLRRELWPLLFRWAVWPPGLLLYSPNLIKISNKIN